MDSREKKQLKRQLEGQASFLVSETSDVALVAGLLTTWVPPSSGRQNRICPPPLPTRSSTRSMPVT